MKTLNNLLLCLTLLGLLTLTSCLDFCNPIERPKDLEPINWENYNDVYTVYWNYVFYNRPEKINDEDSGKEIMICGFATNFGIPSPSASGFTIIDNKNESFPCIYIRPSFGDRDSINQLQTILDTGYLANIKCYIKGTLYFENLTPDMGECQTYQPIIIINNVDDIYFKEEE